MGCGWLDLVFNAWFSERIWCLRKEQIAVVGEEFQRITPRPFKYSTRTPETPRK